jgi:hypothetical protein
VDLLVLINNVLPSHNGHFFVFLVVFLVKKDIDLVLATCIFHLHWRMMHGKGWATRHARRSVKGKGKDRGEGGAKDEAFFQAEFQAE